MFFGFGHFGRVKLTNAELRLLEQASLTAAEVPQQPDTELL